MSTMIKNIVPSLIEWGKIKIGKKGKLVRNTFRVPEKLDHFIITTMEKDNEDNYTLDHELMNKIMEKQNVEKLTTIPITLLYNDIDLNFQSRYACFNGKTKWCTGDGETAKRLNGDAYEDIQCPCERVDPKYTGEDGKGKGKCKASGCLSCIIDGADRVGGVWKFRTTSFNSVRSIISSLLILKRVSGGILAGIPFNLTVSPKTTNNPADGTPVKIYVVNIEYSGSQKMLSDVGLQIAKSKVEQRIKIENIEKEARKLLESRIDEEVVDDEVIDEHVEEFHPEEITSDENVVVESKEESTIDPPFDIDSEELSFFE